MTIDEILEALTELFKKADVFDGHIIREVCNNSIYFIKQQQAEIDRLQRENEQLKEVSRLAAVDMRHNDNCDVCVFKDCQPSCEAECLECGLDCECNKCIDGSSFTWQHANKMKELGVEI